MIRVQTNLVNILASVIDAHGQPIPDLAQDVFELSEEGVPQKIERFEAETNRPLDLALMVDSSMSTYKDMKFETEAAAHFIRQVVRPGDTLGVFEFDEKVTQLSDFSADVPKLQVGGAPDQFGLGNVDLRRDCAGLEFAAAASGRQTAGHRYGDGCGRDDERVEI